MIERFKATKELLRKIFYILTSQQKRLLIPVTAMMLVNGLLQTLGISAIVPLATAMTNPEKMMSNDLVQRICLLFSIDTFPGLFTLLCLFIAFLYLFKNLFGILQNWISLKYSNKVNRELSAMILTAYLYRDYDFFLNYGTAKVMRDVSSDPQHVYATLICLFNICSELVTMIMILVYIVVSDPQMALVLSTVAVICMAVIYIFFKKKVQKSGQLFRDISAETQKTLLQSIEGIKEVQVMQRQDFFLSKYADCFRRQQDQAMVQSIASTSPTYIVEGFFVAGIMFFLGIKTFVTSGSMSSLPLLASFLMGAVRMLPSLSRISSNFNTISYYVPFLNSAYDSVKKLKEELNVSEIDAIGLKLEADRQKREKQEKNKASDISFRRELSLNDISWHYQDSNAWVLDALNISFLKGTSIGIIGQSGAGKSTLADIILGLHKPQRGNVLLDGVDIYNISKAYSNVIGFVPQSVYLIEADVRENIAFGVDRSEIDDEKVWDCLKKAQLSDFIRNQEDGLNTIIGERGVRISGGQRQRIAIARALYRNPQILILDEATSALDNETESAVMEAIEGLHGTVTMIIIAHRLTTVSLCDSVYEIIDGKAVLRDKKDILSQSS